MESRIEYKEVNLTKRTSIWYHATTMCTWISTHWTLQISVDWDYWNVLKLWQLLQWFSFWFIDMIQWWSDARLGPETVFLWWGRYPWTWSWLWWTIIIIIIWVIYCHYTRWRFFQVFVHNENIIHQVWHRDIVSMSQLMVNVYVVVVICLVNCNIQIKISPRKQLFYNSNIELFWQTRCEIVWSDTNCIISRQTKHKCVSP